MNLEQKSQIEKLKNSRSSNPLKRIQRAKVKSLKDMESLATLVAAALTQEMDEKGYVTTAEEVQYRSHPLYLLETNVIKPIQDLNTDEEIYTAKNDELGRWFQTLNATLQYAQMKVTGDVNKLLDTQIALVRPSTSYWYKVNKGKGKYTQTMYTPTYMPKNLIKKELTRLKAPLYGSIALSGLMLILIVNSLRRRG